MVSDAHAIDGDFDDGGYAPGADHIATVQEDVARVSAALNAR